MTRTSTCTSTVSALFDGVAPKFVSQGCLDLGAEGLLLAGGDALQERQGDDRGWHVLVDGRLHRPAALAAVLDVAADAGETGIFLQSVVQELEQPRAHHAAGAPDAGDFR